MWKPFKKLASKSRTVGAMMGDVVFSTAQLQGRSNRSTFQWRVKEGLEGDVFISLKMQADYSAGWEGRENQYISLDIEKAELVRDQLDKCIAFARRSGDIEEGLGA